MDNVSKEVYNFIKYIDMNINVKKEYLENCYDENSLLKPIFHICDVLRNEDINNISYTFFERYTKENIEKNIDISDMDFSTPKHNLKEVEEYLINYYKEKGYEINFRDSKDYKNARFFEIFEKDMDDIDLEINDFER